MNILEEFRRIKTFVFDMDGVLTDGDLLHISGEKWLRKTNMKDGHAIKLASQKAGASFKPFQAGLRKARADLETKPDGLASDSGRNLLEEIRVNGEHVVQELGIINLELKAITRMLTPTNS